MTPSVRDLDIGEMIALSSEWLGELRATFLSIPEIRELLPQVEADHQALVAARGPLPVAGLERGDLGDLAGALDDRHDHLMRALYLGLEGQAEYLRGQDPPAEDEAEVVERAQASLFPEGLDVIQRSYQSEAGNARQMVAVVEGDAALQRVLGRIHLTQEVSALDVVRQIGAVGAVTAPQQ